MPSYHVNEFPWHAPSDARRREIGVDVAKKMLAAALTAPVTGGVDHCEGEIVWGQDEQEAIARKMEELAHTTGNKKLKESFLYEAVMAREADCILFLGSYRARNTPFDVDCGYCSGPDGCGFVYSRRKTAWGQIDPTDRNLQQTPLDGPFCIIRVSDLGFPVGSALWAAKTLMVDCRPFYSMGLAAMKLGYCKESALVVGLPVATTSKNPFVDVHHNYHVVNMPAMVDSVRKHYIITRQSGMDYRHISLEKLMRMGEKSGGEANVQRMKNMVLGKDAEKEGGEE
ncbi:MAG: hypothetical protein JRI97_02035 [Deltaproteobacteria bacterium]|nr:hypothetical protein [Deltaproteobacteria bacterium]